MLESPRTVRTSHPRLHPDKEEARVSGAFCATLQRHPVRNQCGDPCCPPQSAVALKPWVTLGVRKP